jgi:type VI secretion system secreted protein VgrG
MTTQLATHAVVEIESLEGSAVHVAQLDVVEVMSHLSEIRVVADTTDAIDAASLLGKRLTVRVTRTDREGERCFHGIVHGAHVSMEDRFFRLRVAARPRMARLALGRDHRIFQDLSVPEVVQAVVERAGLPADCLELALSGTYEPQPYITQLDESDYDFVSRLLYEEGIGFFVKNDLDAERIVLFDDASAYEPLEATLPFQAEQVLDAVTRVREVRRIASDAVMLRDYDLTRPSVDLSARQEAEGATGREVYLHPGDFLDSARGDRLARVALERLQLHTRVFHGGGAVPSMEPGRTFQLEGHPRSELGQEMLLIAVTHALRGTQLRTSFTAIPSDTPFRPHVERPRPPVGGTHVAFVTGAAGQELHGSEHGQVKVRFPWDRSGITDDRSSTWLRVGQLPLPGSMIVPRVGFEVLVDYELGDADRPLVVGHLYNGEAMPPYELPGAARRSAIQTATTEGGAGANEVRFDDTAGGEEMLVNASFDYTCSVENDARTGVMANETSDIGGNHSVSVTGSYGSVVSGSRSLAVSGNQEVAVAADYSNGTGGDLSVTVGSRNETCGGDLTENIQGTYDLTVGGLMAVTGIAGININVVGASESSVGAAWAETTASSRMSTCGGTRKETVGALKMVKADTVAVSCGAGYVQNCASESVKAGGNRVDSAAAIAVTAAGGLDVDAANINISGQTRVLMRIGGTTIDVKPSSVSIQSSTIKLEGVEKLQSLSEHETA